MTARRKIIWALFRSQRVEKCFCVLKYRDLHISEDWILSSARSNTSSLILGTRGHEVHRRVFRYLPNKDKLDHMLQTEAKLHYLGCWQTSSNVIKRQQTSSNVMKGIRHAIKREECSRTCVYRKSVECNVCVGRKSWVAVCAVEPQHWTRAISWLERKQKQNIPWCSKQHDKIHFVFRIKRKYSMLTFFIDKTSLFQAQR